MRCRWGLFIYPVLLYSVCKMAIQQEIERWVRAQKRVGGAGVSIYIAGTDLAKIFNGQVPEQVEYRSLSTDGQGAVTIQLRGVQQA